jgi:very-short-patch-repair endonuclease
MVPFRVEGLGEGDHNLDKMIALGKILRKRPTEAEQLLWKQLRLKQIEGFKFRRQQPIDKYLEVIRESCLSPTP